MDQANIKSGTLKINPFFVSILFYFVLGILGAVQSSLIKFEILDFVHTLVWVRIHFVTVGIITQIIYGAVPYLVAKSNTIKPNWDVWLFLNSGLITFFYGRTLFNDVVMITGGTLVFIATSLFFIQLLRLRQPGDKQVYFYLAGTFYLLVGIVVGTGIWVEWKDTLAISNPIETHIHANNWGFMALVFSGIIIDQYSKFSGKNFHKPDQIKVIFVLQLLGAFGLILSPWIDNTPLMVLGMLSFMVGTFILLLNIWLPLKGEKKDAGYYHIIFSYIWIIAPLLAAPFVLLAVEFFDYVEPNAPQALIYGWVLQFGFAFIPYFLANLHKSSDIKLGGNLLSIILVNLGAIFLWLGIFVHDLEATLIGIAYMLWALSIIPILVQSYKIISD